jgi:hypothetical protein
MSLEELRNNGHILTEKQWLIRILFLETIAGVPGFFAAMIRHLKGLRSLVRLPFPHVICNVAPPANAPPNRDETVAGFILSWKKLKTSEVSGELVQSDIRTDSGFFKCT